MMMGMEKKHKKEEGGLGDDPTVALEKDISAALMERGKEMLAKIVARLENGCDPVRVLRLLENIAKHHRELIAALHGGDNFHKKHGGFDSLISPSSDEIMMSVGSGGTFGNQEENFGAQALKGLVGALKKPKDTGGEIKALTEALYSAGKMAEHNLCHKIRKRLDHLLDETVIPLGSVDLPSGGEARVEVVDEPKEESDA